MSWPSSCLTAVCAGSSPHGWAELATPTLRQLFWNTSSLICWPKHHGKLSRDFIQISIIPHLESFPIHLRGVWPCRDAVTCPHLCCWVRLLAHSLCWAGRQRWDAAWGEHLHISCLFLPLPFSVGPLLGRREHLHGKYKLCSKNMSDGGVMGSVVQERTSQGLLQQQLGSPRAET